MSQNKAVVIILIRIVQKEQQQKSQNIGWTQ